MTQSAWRVGVLFSQTGVTRDVETAQLRATLIAIDEVNQAGGVAGRPVEAVVRDPASNAREFRRLAEELIREEGVSAIFGCYMSNARKAVLPVVEANRALLFYPTLYEGFEYSASCIYTGAAPNQNSLQLARYLLDHYGRRFLMVGANYVYPYETNRIMADLVTAAGGKVVDEIYVPVEAKSEDFDRVMRRIVQTSPDVVFSTVVGTATATLYEAYARAGIDRARTPIASLTTGEAELAAMSADVAEGHITAAPFFEALATPAAQRFVRAFKARFGEDAPVPAAAEAAYFQFHIAARARAEAGGDDPRVLVEAVRGQEFDAPQGRVRVDPQNNHTWLWPRVARVDAARRFQTVWDPGVRVKPDPYCVVQSLDDWSAAALPVPG